MVKLQTDGCICIASAIHMLCLGESSIHHWHEGVCSAHPCSASQYSPLASSPTVMEKTLLKPCKPFGNCNKQQQQNAFVTPAAISKQTSLWKAEKAAPALIISPDSPDLLQATSCCPQLLQSVSPALHTVLGQGCHISTSRGPPGRCSALLVLLLPFQSCHHSMCCSFSVIWLERGGRKIWGWKGLGSTNTLPWFFFFLILLLGFNVQRHRKGGPWIWRVRMILAVACLREYVRGD